MKFFIFLMVAFLISTCSNSVNNIEDVEDEQADVTADDPDEEIADENIHEEEVEYMWSDVVVPEEAHFGAKLYCANLEESGFSDWKLPTIGQLRTLIVNCPDTEIGGRCLVSDDCSMTDICDKNCKGCSADSSGKYSKLGDSETFRTDSKCTESITDIWVIHFNTAVINCGSDLKDAPDLKVRCVRIKEK